MHPHYTHKWIKKHIPTATFIASTNDLILPPYQPLLSIAPLTSSQILKLIHDMINHPPLPAFTYITPDDIIYIPSANIFIVNPAITLNNQLPATTTTTSTTKYIAPDITPNSYYYSIGQIVDSLWQTSLTPLSKSNPINTKVSNFIIAATTTDYKFVWTLEHS